MDLGDLRKCVFVGILQDAPIAQIRGEFINGIDYLRKCVFVGILQDAPIAQIKGGFINGIDYLRK